MTNIETQQLHGHRISLPEHHSPAIAFPCLAYVLDAYRVSLRKSGGL
jgi:hypothetical protein